MSLEEFTSTESGREQIDVRQEESITTFSSPVLARLIDEVRNNDVTKTHVYDRTHNRHNR